jgi:hypothetical protein
MTDLANFIVLYSNLGIDFEINYSYASDLTYIILAPNDFPGYNDGSKVTVSDRFKGDNFTHCRLYFRGGHFIGQGFYNSIPLEGFHE